MATTGVDVKMGVSGIAQFKQNMKTAQTMVKTLDQELALQEKQFKLTGDAEQYMEGKTKALKEKLEQQKIVLQNAEKALEDLRNKGATPASQAFQKMQQTVLKAKGDLIDTETALENLGTAASDAGDEVSDMNNQLTHIGKNVSFDTIITGLDGITGKMEAAARKAVSLGAKLVKMTLGAGGWADNLVTESTQWSELLGFEVTPEQLYRMEQTSNLIDTGTDTILQSYKKLMTASGKERDQETMGAFAALGINPDQWHDDLEGLFWKTGEGLLALPDAIDKNKYAMKLFGRSWEELAPLFRAGRTEYERTMESWSWIGDENLENLTQMDDEYQRLTTEWEAFQRKFESAMAPALTTVMETLVGLLTQFNKYMSTPEGQEMLETLGEAISGLVSDLAEIDPQKVMEGIKGIFDDLIEGFQWLKDNKDTVVGFVKAFGYAWAALKGVSVITKVLKLVNAITGLTSTAAASAGTAAGSSWASAFATAAMKAAPFLAFLYTLLNPGTTGDAYGNNDLVDAEGNLTAEGADAQAFEAAHPELFHGESNGVNTGRFTGAQWVALQNYWDKYRTGTANTSDWQHMQEVFGGNGELWDSFIQLANEMYTLDRTLEDLPEELFAEPAGTSGTSEMTNAAKNMNGLPAQIRAAVMDGMANVKIYIDGYPMGQVMTPYINNSMGKLLAGVTRG